MLSNDNVFFLFFCITSILGGLLTKIISAGKVDESITPYSLLITVSIIFLISFATLTASFFSECIWFMGLLNRFRGMPHEGEVWYQKIMIAMGSS